MEQVLFLPRPNWLYHRLKLRLRPVKLVELDKVQEILAEYGLELTATPQIPGVMGRSRNLIVHTSRGKKMLKRYKESVTLPAIIHEHSILTRLAQTGFPSPRLVATRSGETLVHREGNVYAVFDFIDGYIQYHNYLLLPAQARRFAALAGRTLATLHEQLKGFVPVEQHPEGFKSLTGDRVRELEWYTGRLTRCLADTPHVGVTEDEASATINVLLRRVDWLQDTFYQLDHVLRSAAPPRLIIHGDYGPYNLLSRRNAPLVVLDFELARLDWRILDLAKAIPNFAYNRRLGFNFGKMRCFLGAYRAHYPIGEEELQLAPLVWQFLHVRRLIVCWYNYCNSRADRWISQIQDHLKWVDWITENRDRLSAHLAATR